MTLTASIAEPLYYRSTATSLIDPATPDLSDLVDTLANRVAHGRLYRCAPTQSEVPERSVARIEPLAAPIGVSWPNDWPRPSRLLDPPAPVEAMALLPDHPPASFTWGGVRRRVKRADGPERIFGEWWVRDGELSVVRDYFQVEDEAGERFWLFRRGDGEDPNTGDHRWRSEEHTSELQSLMRISYAVFCLKKKKHTLELHKRIYQKKTILISTLSVYYMAHSSKKVKDNLHK